MRPKNKSDVAKSLMRTDDDDDIHKPKKGGKCEQKSDRKTYQISNDLAPTFFFLEFDPS